MKLTRMYCGVKCNTKILVACEGDVSKFRTRDPPSKYQPLKSCFYFYQTNF